MPAVSPTVVDDAPVAAERKEKPRRRGDEIAASGGASRSFDRGAAMSRPVIYGARYSVYVRSVLLALVEKGVAHDVVEVDVFAAGGPPPEHLARHPFGKIPAFAHGDFRLYETPAIIRYVDEAFPGLSLQPADLRERARMTQVIGILDSYAYRCWLWDIYVERVSIPKRGGTANEAKIAAALPKAERAAAALADILGDRPFFAGATLSLADLHAAPMVGYFEKAPEGADLLARTPTLAAWWARLRQRPSVSAICI
jgi:glutathione S-transferase